MCLINPQVKTLPVARHYSEIGRTVPPNFACPPPPNLSLVLEICPPLIRSHVGVLVGRTIEYIHIYLKEYLLLLLM